MTSSAIGSAQAGPQRPIALMDPASYVGGSPIDQLLYLQEHQPVYWHREPDDGPTGSSPWTSS
jgi:hypothetical protein